jgi:hypothetical protein
MSDVKKNLIKELFSKIIDKESMEIITQLMDKINYEEIIEKLIGFDAEKND